MATRLSGPLSATLCPQCGKPLPGDVRNCPHCGVDLALFALLAERAYLEGVPQTAPISSTPESIVPRIGEYLIEQGLLTPSQLESALTRQRELAGRGQRRLLGQTLLEMKLVDRETLDRAITRQIIELHAALQEANRNLERRVAERTAELRRALERLTELNQIKANLISNVSHELRTPLAHIKGYVELLAEEQLGPLSDEQKKALGIMQRASERLERLIEDLIDFSTASREGLTLKLIPVSLPGLAADVIERSREKAERAGVGLDTAIQLDLPELVVDPEKLRWVLFQLIDNGIKFTPSGGRVSLEASPDGQVVIISVRDTGIGIAPDRIEEIFEPFHQLDGSPTRRYGGTGLGLSLVKLILRAWCPGARRERRGERHRDELRLAHLRPRMTGPLIPPGPLSHGTELNAVYAIARIVAETYDTEAGLDAVFRLARTIFIFDVVALYLQNEESRELEPSYARALGRGRAHEAELAWGEPAAREAFLSGQTVLRQEDAGPEIEGRERRRDYLGLPLMVSGRGVGGLVFGRFGGPPYPAEHIRLAEFVAWHVGQLLENRRMASRIASLEAQRELARMQDEFVSTVSHELRTPLGFIKGYVTTLLRDDTDWDRETSSEFLRIIDEESDRLRELIDNLLDSSRLETGSLGMTCEPTRISTLVRATASRAQSLYPGMQLAVDVADDLPIVRLDSTRIAQVLDNLLSNAHKYARRSRPPRSASSRRAISSASKCRTAARG